MATATSEQLLTIRDYKEDVHNDWCPGCGDFGIVTALQMALAKLQIPPHKTTIVSGIGCAAKTPHYMSTYGFHTLHGRILPALTGFKLANPTVTVIGTGGDGDAYAIGGGHFLSGGRRNLDITYLVYNNNVYALTKGQGSPTIGKGQKTKSMSEASIMNAISPVALGIACGYTFLARGYALDVKKLSGIIAQAIEHRGSALVDILQTCPTYNDLHTKTWYEGKKPGQEGQSPLYNLGEDYDPVVHYPDDPEEVIRKKNQAIAKASEAGRIGVGVYYKCEIPTLEDYLVRAGSLNREKPPAENPGIFTRDIGPLLAALE